MLNDSTDEGLKSCAEAVLISQATGLPVETRTTKAGTQLYPGDPLQLLRPRIQKSLDDKSAYTRAAAGIVETYLNLALENNGKAIEVLRNVKPQSVPSDSLDGTSNAWRAWLMLSTGEKGFKQYEAAKEAINKSIESGPVMFKAELLYKRGVLQQTLDQHELAGKDFKESINCCPEDNPRLLAHCAGALSRVLSKQGNTSDADFFHKQMLAHRRKAEKMGLLDHEKVSWLVFIRRWVIRAIFMVVLYYFYRAYIFPAPKEDIPPDAVASR
mmetsp:Transcript_33358/g.51880  ORF Transcript_33358/g.51880 Transcript_33358/m.51880 type:complete len:270 (+) Transcript_33358:133-942(+)